MITIFQRKNCSSSQKTIFWFKKYNIKYQEYNINSIPKQQLVQVLSLTDGGFTSIVKIQGDAQTQSKIKKLYQKKSFNNALTYLKMHPEILRTPIIFSDNKILIGYNEDEIRKFLPKIYRKQNRNF